MAQRRQPLTRTRDELRRSFWLEASIAFLAGTALGLALPGVGGWLDLDVPLLDFGGGTASSVLETIATVSLAVAGISFSVIMVAFTLASQQHGPRVLPTFQADRLSHAVLAMFLGTFIYSLVVLGRIRSEAHGAPELALTVAIALAAVSFAFFIAFIHHVVRMLQISEIIRRIAVDGRSALDGRFPDQLGRDPADPAGARAQAQALTSGAPTAVVRAARAGFLASIAPRQDDRRRCYPRPSRVKRPLSTTPIAFATRNDGWCSTAEPVARCERLPPAVRCQRAGCASSQRSTAALAWSTAASGVAP